MVAIQVIIGLFLVAHGLVHLLYFVPPSPDFPMTPDKSWLVRQAGVSLKVVVPLVRTLAVAGAAGFVLLAFSFWDLGVPREWFVPLAVVAAAVSLDLLALTWIRSFVFAVLIDLGVIVWAVGWGPVPS